MSLVHKFAFQQPTLAAQAISAVAMPELSRRLGVRGTPTTLIGDALRLPGRLSEARLLAALQAAADASTPAA